MSTNSTVLLVLAVLTWLVLAADLATVIGADGTGDRDIFLGLRWLVAGALVFALWLWLGGLLLMAGGQGVLPRWIQLAALTLGPVSAASAFAALYLSNQLAVRWPMVVAMTIPVLIAGYVVLLYQPALRSTALSPVVAGGVWGAVLILSAVIWPAAGARMAERSRERAEQGQAMADYTAQENEKRHAENLVKLKGMRPDQHLVDWYSLLAPDSGVRPQAIEALKTVERRQGDVEEGLGYGIPAIMKLVPELDLKYTPQLCEAAQSYLQKTAKSMRIRNREPYPYASDESLDASLPGIRWFTTRGCPCNEAIAAIEASARMYLDSPDRQKLLAALAGLGTAH